MAELQLYQSPFEPSGEWLNRLQESRHRQPPAALLPWLLHPGSLTAALRELADGDFHVRILKQHWQNPRMDERRELALRDRCRALVREVLLYGRGQPWVYARSVLPESSLRGRSRYLRNLDNRPLGELLFSEAGIRRGPIALNRLHRNPRCDLPELAGEGDSAWGRRSAFWLRGKPLLVTEAFLSAFRPQRAPLARAEVSAEQTGG
ncbi:chorismate lyase [Microbulbifer thermotolerans]|nr:chorismate lyase [Microbulbifer thermotolerans]